MTSCGPKIQPRKGASGKTGWAYNDPKMGGFEVAEYVEQEAGPGLVLIEGGTFTMGSVEQDVMYDWNSMRKRVTVSSFYMDETEISNVDYREYLNWIYKVFFDEYPELYLKALPDTLCWRRRLAFNEPYVQFYFRHPAYNDYPAVGVSWDQASEYCLWRTDRVNEQILVDLGFIDWNPDPSPELYFSTDAYLVYDSYEMETDNRLTNISTGDYRNVKMEDGILPPATASPPRLSGSTPPTPSSATPSTNVCSRESSTRGTVTTPAPTTSATMVTSLPTPAAAVATSWVWPAT